MHVIIITRRDQREVARATLVASMANGTMEAAATEQPLRGGLKHPDGVPQSQSSTAATQTAAPLHLTFL
eukprot:4069663-Prymnesium_polylepis.2